ncbi:hypothetical protein, partial [Gelidibacter salicanalis]|uniref:hypothetical protein n=1 Tax=Gelidibacter salicanalis TaxID=291193 RepID=UPI001F2308B9
MERIKYIINISLANKFWELELYLCVSDPAELVMLSSQTAIQNGPISKLAKFELPFCSPNVE